MIDLKGPLIRTLGFKDTMYSIRVLTGQEIRISTNKALKGDEGMFGIDYDSIHEKLIVGDKVLVDYGGVVLTVIGFESEKAYIHAQQKKKKFKELLNNLDEQANMVNHLSSSILGAHSSDMVTVDQQPNSSVTGELINSPPKTIINYTLPTSQQA